MISVPTIQFDAKCALLLCFFATSQVIASQSNYSEIGVKPENFFKNLMNDSWKNLSLVQIYQSQNQANKFPEIVTSDYQNRYRDEEEEPGFQLGTFGTRLTGNILALLTSAVTVDLPGILLNSFGIANDDSVGSRMRKFFLWVTNGTGKLPLLPILKFPEPTRPPVLFNVTAIRDRLQAEAAQAGSTVHESLNHAHSSASSFGSNLGSTIDENLSHAHSSASGFLQNVGSSVSDRIGNGQSSVSSAFGSNVGSSLQNSLSHAQSSISGFGSNLDSKIDSSLSQAHSSVSGFGSNAGSSVANFGSRVSPENQQQPSSQSFSSVLSNGYYLYEKPSVNSQTQGLTTGSQTQNQKFQYWENLDSIATTSTAATDNYDYGQNQWSSESKTESVYDVDDEYDGENYDLPT